MNNNAVFYTFQPLTLSATERGSSCAGESWPSSRTCSRGNHSGSLKPQESPDFSSTCSNYHIRPLPVIPFLLNNKNSNTDDSVMTDDQQRRRSLHIEQDGRTRPVNKREWIVPEAATEDEQTLLLTKRARPNQTKSVWCHDQSHQDYPTITNNTAPPLMHIDLIVSHVLGYLSWREQLHCRSVSKVWRDAYLSAPTRFLLCMESQPSPSSLPRVLQPSHLDRFSNQISWNSMKRIGSLATKLTLSTPAGALKKRISRLDIYGSSREAPTRANAESNILRVLKTMQLLHQTTIQSSFVVEELRLLYINHDDFDRYLNHHHDARFPEESQSSGLGSSSAVHRLVIRDHHQHFEDNTLGAPQMINHYHRQSSSSHIPHFHLAHIQTVTPKLQLLDINANIFHLR